MADVTAAGLTTVEATARRARDGANTLPAAKRPSVFRRLLGELTHFFAVLLWGRQQLGWRGHKAIRWTLAGFCLLMLAYFGSKLVREFILHI